MKTKMMLGLYVLLMSANTMAEETPKLTKILVRNMHQTDYFDWTMGSNEVIAEIRCEYSYLYEQNLLTYRKRGSVPNAKPTVFFDFENPAVCEAALKEIRKVFQQSGYACLEDNGSEFKVTAEFEKCKN